MTDLLDERDDMFVGGAFVRATSRERLVLVSPVTEEQIATVPVAGAADVDQAVAAARSALVSWRETTPAQRGAFLSALADAYEVRKHEISALVAAQNGSPQWWAIQESERGAPAVYRRCSAVAREFEPERIDSVGERRTLVRREPVGVVGVIIPWNSPQVHLAMKIGAALAAGCTVVAKPAPETSLDAYLIAELCTEVGLPPGTVNIVTGGSTTGEALVRHPEVDKVSFTGSTAAGRSIASACGGALKPVTAELGGKSAAVLLEDADLELFQSLMLRQCVPFSAQVCYSCTRVLAPRRRFAEVLDAVASTMGGFVFGDPRDPRTELGPLVSARQLARVRGYIDAGVRDGARIVTGGSPPVEFDRGYYVPPTVFADVEPSMSIFRDEIFGPVMTVVAYGDEKEAVALHDATDYGLHGSVYSADLERATAFARRLATGGLSLNGAIGAGLSARAAYKHSGIGMGGAPVIDEYLLAKQVALSG